MRVLTEPVGGGSDRALWHRERRDRDRDGGDRDGDSRNRDDRGVGIPHLGVVLEGAWTITIGTYSSVS
jgi:hypothetical protein